MEKHTSYLGVNIYIIYIITGELRATTPNTSINFADTTGKPIVCHAMVAHAPKQPLTLEKIIVEAPKKGEVRVKVVSNALCHTDVYTLDGLDPEGINCIHICIYKYNIPYNS